MNGRAHHKRGLLGGLGNTLGNTVNGLTNGAGSLVQGAGNLLTGNKSTSSAHNGGGSAQPTQAQGGGGGGQQQQQSQAQPQPSTTPTAQVQTTPAAQQNQPTGNANSNSNNNNSNNSNNNNNNNNGGGSVASQVDSGAGGSNSVAVPQSTLVITTDASGVAQTQVVAVSGASPTQSGKGGNGVIAADDAVQASTTIQTNVMVQTTAIVNGQLTTFSTSVPTSISIPAAAAATAHSSPVAAACGSVLAILILIGLVVLLLLRRSYKKKRAMNQCDEEDLVAPPRMRGFGTRPVSMDSFACSGSSDGMPSPPASVHLMDMSSPPPSALGHGEDQMIEIPLHGQSFIPGHFHQQSMNSMDQPMTPTLNMFPTPPATVVSDRTTIRRLSGTVTAEERNPFRDSEASTTSGNALSDLSYDPFASLPVSTAHGYAM